MFGFGDEKDELRENMEEIKDIIENEESRNTSQEGSQKPDQASSESRDPRDEVNQRKPEPGNQETQTSGRQQPVDNSTTQSQIESEIPEPPERREVNVPEVQKGPLFIRQEKFRRARNLVQDMRYLVQEINKSSGSLESTLQEEEQIEQDVASLLGELEEERTEVRDIVSPGDQN